jgi:RND family efflux transporter MFP subunit
MAQVRFRLAAALAAGVLAGCGARHAAPAPRAEAPLASVLVEPVQIPAERFFDGIVKAVNRATIVAQTSGRIAAVYRDVNDTVPAGALLMRLRATMQRADLLKAQAALRAARARAREAQTRYRRILAMYQQRVLPKADFDRVRAARDAAVAQMNAARAALESATEGVAYTEIRAPYAGVVIERLVQVGEAVAPGTPLVKVASLQDLRVVLSVPQSLAGAVRRAGKGMVYVGGRWIVARRVTVFPAASALSNTFRVRLALPVAVPGLYPGMVVRAAFVTGERQRLLVPCSAVVRRSAVTAVYLLQPNGDVLMQQVRVGERRGNRIEVLSGLMAGDRVALDPLRAVQRLEPFPDMAGTAQ